MPSRSVPSVVLALVCTLAGCAPDRPASTPTLADALAAGDTLAIEALGLNRSQLDSALVRGASGSPTSTIRYLLGRGADPDFVLDDFGTTALMSAAGADRAEVVTVLLDAGADPDRADSLGDPAINWAAYMGAADAVGELLQRGASPSVRTVHGDALGIALRRGHRDIVDRLVAEGVVDYPRPSAEQEVWLDAVATGRPAARDMVVRGADMSFLDGAGSPALVEAAAFGRTDVVRALVETAGVDVEVRDHAGFTALSVAAREGHDETVLALIDLGADVQTKSSPLGMGMTPLMLAGAWGHTSTVEILIDGGADLEAVNAMGYPALLWTLSAGHEEAARVMVERGADIHLEVDGYSARSAAEMLGMTGLVGVMDDLQGR